MNEQIKQIGNDFEVVRDPFEVWWENEMKKIPVLVRASKEVARKQWNTGVEMIKSGN